MTILNLFMITYFYNEVVYSSFVLPISIMNRNYIHVLQKRMNGLLYLFKSLTELAVLLFKC